MATCKNCNSSINKQEQFCRCCGIKLEHTDEESSTSIEESTTALEEEIFKPKPNENKIVAPLLAGVIIIIALISIFKLKSGAESFLSTENSKNFIKSGDWIYCSLNNFNGATNKNEYGIYKISQDNKTKVKLYDDMAIALVVRDNWIYYSSLNDKGRLYKLGTDGLNREIVSEDVSLQLALKGNYLIYRTEDEQKTLYKLDLKNNSKVKLAENVLNFSMSRNSVYYSASESLGRIYHINLNGTEKKELFTLEGPILYANDNYVYFMDVGIREDAANSSNRYLFFNNRGEIYRSNLDGSNRKLIVPNESFSFTRYGNKFYYQSINKGNIEAYEIDFEGRNRKKLASNINIINIVDDWIYYVDRGDGLFYRMNIESGEKESIN